MKTTSAWMPEAADESTILELAREMLELDVPVVRRGGGFRISVASETALTEETV